MEELPDRLTVRLLVAWSGEGFSYERDAVIEVDRELALALCHDPRVPGEGEPRAIPVGWQLPAELQPEHGPRRVTQ